MKVLLADDDAHVRSALRLLLENESGISIVGDCADSANLVDQVSCSGASVVLLDWDLPGLRADGILERLRAEHPICRLLALSGRPEERADALGAGADTFVCKGDAPDSLLSALRELQLVEPQAEPGE